MGLFRVEGETMGAKLLKKMGWREGQGVGPKVRRKARLDLQNDASADGDTFLFAPENVLMISFTRKTDRKGLGFAGGAKLTPLGMPARDGTAEQSDEDEEDDGSSLGRPKFSLSTGRKKESKKVKGGIGIGVLNDTGSDDEDPYEIGPRISYNRVIGGDRKKKKPPAPVNPTLKTKPTFISKKLSGLGKVALGVRKCHDGRLPLDGFVFGKEPDALTSEVNSGGKYPPPTIPPGWVSSKKPKSHSGPKDYVSTADAAKASTLDPKARAALLGEKQLPGKSVFDFMSPSARERLAAVTGRADLPQAKGEVPAGFARSEAERMQELVERVPTLDRETAVAALSRGAGGGAPYADDEAKRGRYRAYLEHQAGFRPALPSPPKLSQTDDWLKELHEFFNCARIFKPMTGFMASKFTTSSSSTVRPAGPGGADAGDGDSLVTKPPPKPEHPAEAAAKLGMFGSMTRSTEDFFPTRLLCKRFNVKPPAHVQPDQDFGSGSSKPSKPPSYPTYYGEEAFDVHLGKSGVFGTEPGTAASGFSSTHAPVVPPITMQEEAVKPAPVIDSSKNEALEGKRAGEEVFKAIFGDSDDDE